MKTFAKLRKKINILHTQYASSPTLSKYDQTILNDNFIDGIDLFKKNQSLQLG